MKQPAALLIVLLIASCAGDVKKRSPFVFDTYDQGFLLSENGKPVYFYQKMPKSLTGRYICNNYIHPLYNLKGEIITEEFPADHPFHRGVFWAWHQIYMDTVRLGDGWTNDSISYDVQELRAESNTEQARLETKVLWKSSCLSDSLPFAEEKTIITVHRMENEIRKIDFQINLKPLVNGLRIGGSADPKGYGGFCVRMLMPDGLTFTSEGGEVTPQELQVKAGPWMDFSGPFGADGHISGLTILSHPLMESYYGRWILRQKGSMQNAVCPGKERIDVTADRPLSLYYRLIIHNGDAASIDPGILQEEFARQQPR